MRAFTAKFITCDILLPDVLKETREEGRCSIIIKERGPYDDVGLRNKTLKCGRNDGIIAKHGGIMLTLH